MKWFRVTQSWKHLTRFLLPLPQIKDVHLCLLDVLRAWFIKVIKNKQTKPQLLGLSQNLI